MAKKKTYLVMLHFSVKILLNQKKKDWINIYTSVTKLFPIPWMMMTFNERQSSSRKSCLLIVFSILTTKSCMAAWEGQGMKEGVISFVFKYLNDDEPLHSFIYHAALFYAYKITYILFKILDNWAWMIVLQGIIRAISNDYV